tara:strand:- start:480 stop:686 length:207 start_codon:yes stop_codon:yes gene_type:complete
LVSARRAIKCATANGKRGKISGPERVWPAVRAEGEAEAQRTVIVKSKIEIRISYEIIWAAARRPPRRA